MSAGWQTRMQEDLLPDRLKMTWRIMESGEITAEEFEQRREQWLREYISIWGQALLLDDQTDLEQSLIQEIALFSGVEPAEAERRCRGAVRAIADEWNAQVDAGSRQSVERYYDQTEGYIYDLMWWHALNDDDSPLGYVTALDFARRK